MSRTLHALASRLALPLLACSTLVFVSPAARAQRLTTPMASPAASFSQTIGITDVTVTTGRPAVKGRDVWGALVPWGEVWRAGANENTTITLAHDATIEGKALPAGTYGLHMIPQRDRWTVIFSRNATSWGSYSYDPKEDALRVDVVPVAAAHAEWLSYEFTDLERDKATLQLRWEKLAVPVKIAVDTDSIVLGVAREAFLRGPGKWQADAWSSAAAYCLGRRINLEEGLTWAQHSVSMKPGFTNQWTLASLQAATGKTADAATTREKAMAFANETELNDAGYQFLQSGKVDEALALFKHNADSHPDSWNAWDSLAECYVAKGDKKQAIEHYGKALSLASDDNQKSRIETELKKLGS